MIYTLENQNLRISVNEQGGELVSVIKDGKEWIWQNESGEWAGHAPLLFPVCGHFGVTVDGVSYPIGAHGFVKKSKFTLVEQTKESLHLQIKADENTKKVYPFDFVFHVIYRIEGSKLTVEYLVENPAQKPLYFACGSHESFNVEGNVDEYALCFENEEHFLHYYHDAGGYLTGATKDFGKGKLFSLPRDFLQGGETLIFKGLQSHKLSLVKAANGKPLAHICFDGFDNLLLWRNGDAPFICIEPWNNLPDMAGAKDIEFSKKQGVIEVPPTSTKSMVHSIEYV